MTPTSEVTVLIPARLQEHAVERIGSTFRMLRIERADAALLPAEERAKVRGVAGMTRMDAAFMDALPALEIIASFGVGYDAVDARHAGSRGIMVTNTPDVLTDEVADTAVALLLNTVRDLPRAETYLRAGRWKNEGNFPLTRLTLRGRSVGIYGMGRIGQAVARRLEAFGLQISYHNRNPVAGVPYRYYPSLTELARNVDTLVSVAPGGDATHRAVNAEVLAALGTNGVFINIGRGSTVDEEALAKALADGTIAAAGLDVYAAEPEVPQALLDLDNVCLLPHVGSASMHTRRAMSDLVVDNLVAWFTKGQAITPVFETANVVKRRA